MDLLTHDIAVLRRLLWAAVYSEQHVPSRRDRRHRRDMQSRGFDQAERTRFRAAAHRYAFPRLNRAEHASVALHALQHYDLTHQKGASRFSIVFGHKIELGIADKT